MQGLKAEPWCKPIPIGKSLASPLGVLPLQGGSFPKKE